MKIIFNDEQEIEGKIIIDGNKASIYTDEKPNLSGFRTVNYGVQIGTYNNYNTLYSKEDGKYTLSCDGSVKPVPIPFVPHIPTEEELEALEKAFEEAEREAEAQITLEDVVETIDELAGEIADIVEAIDELAEMLA